MSDTVNFFISLESLGLCPYFYAVTVGKYPLIVRELLWQNVASMKSKEKPRNSTGQSRGVIDVT